MKNSIVLSILILTTLLSFSFSNVQAQEPGEYYIQSALGGKYMDVQWGKADSGTPLHLWPYNGGVAQKFKLIDAGGGYFFIQSNLGRYIQITNASRNTQVLPTLGDYANQNHFKWQFVSAGNGYYLIRSKMGTYLDVKWGNSADGTPIWMWTHNGGNAQKWKLHPTQTSTSTQEVTRVNAALWQTAFNVALQSVRAKVNNFTPRDFAHTRDNTFRWYKPDDCYLRINNGSQPYIQTFDLKPFRAEPMTIYVQDIHLNRATVSPENGKLKIRLQFDENDPEVRTNCIDNFGCGGIGNPNFNMVKPEIEVLIRPIIVNGRLSYEDAEVRISGHLDHIGVNLTVGMIQAVFAMMNFDANNELRTKGAKFMTDYLNQNNTKASISNILNNSLSQASRYGFTIPANLTDIRIAGNGDLLLYQ